MATIDKLEYLDETKNQIKTALNDLGAEITDNDTFRSYVTKINELYAEYPSTEEIANIQAIQPQSINLQTINPQIIEEPIEELNPQDEEV